MTPRSVLPVLLALLALPLAAAAYGEGSTLTVAAPANVEGRADTLLPSGAASFVSPSSGAPVSVRLVAPEVQLSFISYADCAPETSVPGLPPTRCARPQEPQVESLVLRGATVTVLKPLSAYKVLVTTDRAYADSTSFGANGALVATTGSVQLGAADAAARLHGAGGGWGDDEPRFEPVYEAEAGAARFAATGGILRATDGFETFLQGVQVSVVGTDEDGDEFERTFDTRMPASAEEPYRVVVLESSAGSELYSVSTAPLLAYAPADQRPITDVHTRVSFRDATGAVVSDGRREERAGEDVTLAGPLSLQLTKVEGDRLTYAIRDGLQLASLATEPQDDSPIPPEALAAAGAAGAGGAGALIALAYFWPRLKYALTLAFLPMYTRIERDAVLEHEKRDELYELIRQTPGIHAHEIGEKAHIGWGTTVYHLKLLESHGLIVSKKSGRYKRFFVNTGEYTKKKDVYGALRNDTAKAVADYIVNHPGTTQKEMCAALGIQPSLASWHVEKLEGVELVKRVKDGRMVRYFAGPAWSELNVRVDPLRAGADTPVET